MDLKGSQTEKNLLKAFAGESRARNKYNFYAEKARETGDYALAKVWDETADNEKAHAREVFRRYLKLVGTNLENLKDSSAGEAFEWKNLYKDFEKVARTEGFKEIADFFKELAEVEEHHDMRFKELENNMTSKEKRPSDTMWMCTNCGYIHIGEEPPEICPLCKYPKGAFSLYCDPFKGSEK